jgi:hypothetical protein
MIRVVSTRASRTAGQPKVFHLGICLVLCIRDLHCVRTTKTRVVRRVDWLEDLHFVELFHLFPHSLYWILVQNSLQLIHSQVVGLKHPMR